DVVGEREAVVLVIDGVSFEELLSAEAFRRAASSGGAALMTTYPASASDAVAYAALGSGGADRGAGPTPLDRTLGKSGISMCGGDVGGGLLPPGSPSLLSD